MGLIAKIGSALLGGGVVKTAQGVANIIDQFVETEEERKAADIILMKVQQDPDKWQMEVNKLEATHRSIFVAGWRPAIGWICAFSLAWGWIVRPIVVTVLGAFKVVGVDVPGIEVQEAISLIMAMLGMGALRTYEKRQGLTG